MSVSTVNNSLSSLTPAANPVGQAPGGLASAASFATTLAGLGNGTHYTDDEVKGFFASKPSQQQIANQAAALNMNEDQIVRAMQVGGYESSDRDQLKSGIEAFASDPKNGFSWNASGSLTAAKAVAQAVVSVSATAMPSAADSKAFFDTAPSDAQLTAKIKSLGLNAAQTVQFRVAGTGLDISQIPASALESWYADAAKRVGEDVGGGMNIGSLNGGWTSCFSPTLGRAVTKTELQDFFSKNPTTNEIFQKASSLGVGLTAINTVMVGLGKLDSYKAALSNYEAMDSSLYHGKNGYSMDQLGHIVAGGGHQ
jgi:hypothetical protein